MKKVLIINEGLSDNLGDQAINNSMVELFKNYGYTTSFLYFSKPKIQRLKNVSYFSNKILKKKSNLFIKILKSYVYFFYWIIKNKKIITENLKQGNYDKIIIGGGQLILSSGDLSINGFPIYFYWYTLLLKKHTTAKIYVIAVGSSKNFNSIEQKLYTKSLNRVDAIWTRDKTSREILNNTFRKKSYLIPDIAFYKKKKETSILKEEIALIGITNYNEVYLKYNKTNVKSKLEYYNDLLKKIKEYEHKNCSIKLFYTTISDAKECIQFNEFLYENNQSKIEVCKIKNITNLYEYLKKAKYVYSGRMHALILGLKFSCFVEPHLISLKLRTFNNEYIKSNISMIELNEKINKSIKKIL